MNPADPPPPADPALAEWLAAREPAAADRALAALIEQIAMPVVRQTLGRKLGGASTDEGQEAISRVREQLVRAAQRMRTPGAPPVRDFAGYVATVTRTVWAECLRHKYPARALLSHRLRYLLENRTGQTGFALWTAAGADEALLCGFEAWRVKPAAPAEALRRLLVNPHLADDAHPAAVSGSLPATVARTLRWLGGPAPFADVLTIVADRLGINETPAPWEAEQETADASSDPAAAPDEALRWREYLTWLWNEMSRLPLRQRRAFLLHSSAAHELEYSAIATIRQQAVLLELAPEAFAEQWKHLPLDDLTIAAQLGVTRQQVINLRKVARATLGLAWSQWIGQRPSAKISGHNGAISSSA